MQVGHAVCRREVGQERFRAAQDHVNGVGVAIGDEGGFVEGFGAQTGLRFGVGARFLHLPLDGRPLLRKPVRQGHRLGGGGNERRVQQGPRGRGEQVGCT